MAGGSNFFFQVFKASWRIPEGQSARVAIQIDAGMVWTATAQGRRNGLEWLIGIEEIVNFERLFRRGLVMRIMFLDGDEAPWVARLTGSNAIMSAFATCMGVINEHSRPTQPYGSSPPPAAPTQPFGSQSAPSMPLPAPPSGGGPERRM